MLRCTRTYPRIYRRIFHAGGPEAGSLPPAGYEDGRVPQGQDPQQFHTEHFRIGSSTAFQKSLNHCHQEKRTRSCPKIIPGTSVGLRSSAGQPRWGWTNAPAKGSVEVPSSIILG